MIRRHMPILNDLRFCVFQTIRVLCSVRVGVERKRKMFSMNNEVIKNLASKSDETTIEPIPKKDGSSSCD